MALPGLTPVRTATDESSIWRDVGLAAFRSNITVLKRLTDIPAAKATHTRSVSSDTAASDARFILPFETERSLSNDFALIASLKQDGASVTAAVLEESAEGDALIVRCASNRRIPSAAETVLNSILGALQECAKGSVDCLMVATRTRLITNRNEPPCLRRSGL